MDYETNYTNDNFNIFSFIICIVSFIIIVYLIINYYITQSNNLQVNNSESNNLQVNESICIDSDIECASKALKGECNTLTNCCSSCRMVNNYNINRNLITFNNSIYYTLAGINEDYRSASNIISRIFDICINNINIDNVKSELSKNKILFLIGNSAGDFSEFEILKNMRSIDGNRNILDIKAFGPNKPIPGYISNTFSTCVEEQRTENIIFHELMHAIHYYGFDDNLKNVLNNLYIKYNVQNNNYNVKDVYAFVNVYEFFAEMAQVFTGMTNRLDVTGNITKDVLKNYLPDIYNFLVELYPKPDIMKNELCNILNCDFCKT